MRLIKSNDFYSIKVRGYVTSLHLDVLDVLYQPFIGFSATALYRYLFYTRTFRKGEPISFTLIHQHLGFTYNQLTTAFNSLEAVGLVRSYFIKRKEFNEYLLELYAPKDPAGFSRDQIFMHLLNEAVGPRHSQELLGLYTLDAQTNNQEEVTSDFALVFGPKIQNIDVNLNDNQPILENGIATVKIPFDDTLFFNILTSKRKIFPTSISSGELKIIKQLAGLFDISEEGMVEQVGDYYDGTMPFGKRVDFETMRKHLQEIIKYPTISKPIRRVKPKLLVENSDKTALINKMEVMGPIDFLLMLNEGTKIAPADHKILETLAIDYNLNPPVINALIYFTLLHNNNELIRALIEKNASKLARHKVYTALDALDSLEKGPVRRSKSAVVNDIKEETIEEDDTLDPIWDEIRKL